jgi:hypothetical protein
MREFNARELDLLDFGDVLTRLQIGVDDVVLEKTSSIPEADVICCRYKGRRFNIKFDLDYGVCIEMLDDLSDYEIADIVNRLKR